MNFSYKKQDGHTKKCLVRGFKVNTSSTDILYNQIAKSQAFKVNSVIKISTDKHLILKAFETNNNCHYLHLALFNPKAQVSITPLKKMTSDLLDVENLDDLHAFLMVKDNRIASLMQISTNWCEVKIAKMLNQFGISVTPTPILKNNVIQKIKEDKLKALHLNIDVDESDFVKAPGLIESIFKKEPTVGAKGISGHLTIDAKGNAELAQSIENNPATWVSDLDQDFYIETKKGEKFYSDDMKVTKTYFTVPYGSKSINAKYAKEILEDFVAKEL
ncbi:hypothetical protein ACY2PK_001099 [Klebsiella aerogenes]|uniref:hypothetical protein n=1 Tax=Klebsiella aerogenes TaxID=548 RepID=UPI0005EDF036|nr:hypothetical protein [Klebsiella aerogenes]EMF0788807.1 hypothetical protein [Klebsiella aerogenes]KJL90120.1 hypothetical protein SS11_02495 [Klebsiella aerogenes]HBR6851089.1 hypothetical protein [Klebsiella aerogenes]HDH0701720.1 hypothetical protein [Klebsiella aerogenes]HDT1803438.1 hypothetical protein [Klebsiella aerogenes]